MTRSELEALYRKYFLDVRKFEPFPMTLNYENVLDFVEWLDEQPKFSYDMSWEEQMSRYGEPL
jgi:hypothetical protein